MLTPRADRRPVYLNLLLIRFPISAWISILHRITGVLMVLVMLPMLALFHASLTTAGFVWIQEVIALWWVKLGILLGLWMLLHHLVVGIRHLLLDIEWGIDLPRLLHTAWVSLYLPLGLTFLISTGWWL